MMEEKKRDKKEGTEIYGGIIRKQIKMKENRLSKRE